MGKGMALFKVCGNVRSALKAEREKRSAYEQYRIELAESVESVIAAAVAIAWLCVVTCLLVGAAS